jgi:hypothetical protein
VRVLLLALALYTATVSPATAANKSVGVLVSGESMKMPAQSQAEKWLRGHGQKVITNPMPVDAVKILLDCLKILLDCFVLDDPKCMSSVVDARSTTDSLVSIRVDVASKKQRELRLTIDWFVKGHGPVSVRRTCDDCSDETLRETIDAMLGELVKTVPGFMGRVKVTSTPPGITVLLDNETIGVTPLERDVAVGAHEIRLARDGRTSEPKSITVESGPALEVTLQPPPAGTDVGPRTEHRSRLLPGLCIGIGVAAIAAGTALYLTDEDPTGKAPTYRDTAPLGVGMGAGGAALLLTGVIVIAATSSSSTPTMAVTPGGATVGWAARF